MLVLMLVAMQFAVAAVVVAIKRSAVIWSVLLGWLMFKERDIADRLIASVVMAAGVLVFSSPSRMPPETRCFPCPQPWPWLPVCWS